MNVKYLGYIFKILGGRKMCKKCREERLMTNCSVCIVGKKKMEIMLNEKLKLKKIS